MSTLTHFLSAAGFAAVLAGASAFPPRPLAIEGSTAARHLRLVKSEPAKNDSVSSISVVKLWFSLKPSTPLTRIRLKSPNGTEVTLGPAAPDSADDKLMVAPISAPLPAGRYTVSWKTASSDGHPISGDFAFVVTAK
jgi:copper resistance protein C